MFITKKELEFDLVLLKEFGLTFEELEGYLDFFEEELELEEEDNKKMEKFN